MSAAVAVAAAAVAVAVAEGASSVDDSDDMVLMESSVLVCPQWNEVFR